MDLGLKETHLLDLDPICTKRTPRSTIIIRWSLMFYVRWITLIIQK